MTRFLMQSMMGMAMLAAVVALAGCGGKRAQTPVRTSVNFTETRRQLDQVGIQLQQTQAALNDLVRNPQPDLRPQFTRFEENFNLTRDQARELWRNVESVRTSGRAMMAAWDAELSKIDRQDLRELGRKRREAFGQRFDQIDTGFRALRKDMDPYLAGLDDMIDFLRVDLNPNSLNDVRVLSEDANDQAAVISRQINELSSLLGTTASDISPVAPPSTRPTTNQRPFGPVRSTEPSTAP